MSNPIECTAYPVIFTVHGRTYVSPVKGEGWLEVPNGTTVDDIEFIVSNRRPQAWPGSRVMVKVIPSSDPTNPPYQVTSYNGEYSCECDGWFYRKTCRHIALAREEKEGWEQAIPVAGSPPPSGPWWREH